eukprot:Rhum_TRINITY_DN14924_c13_g3::Rhum_TRINITY_DN14924_c13_g3_i1::g.129094::m.129094
MPPYVTAASLASFAAFQSAVDAHAGVRLEDASAAAAAAAAADAASRARASRCAASNPLSFLCSASFSVRSAASAASAAASLAGRSSSPSACRTAAASAAAAFASSSEALFAFASAAAVSAAAAAIARSSSSRRRTWARSAALSFSAAPSSDAAADDDCCTAPASSTGRVSVTDRGGGDGGGWATVDMLMAAVCLTPSRRPSRSRLSSFRAASSASLRSNRFCSSARAAFESWATRVIFRVLACSSSSRRRPSSPMALMRLFALARSFLYRRMDSSSRFRLASAASESACTRCTSRSSSRTFAVADASFAACSGCASLRRRTSARAPSASSASACAPSFERSFSCSAAASAARASAASSASDTFACRISIFASHVFFSATSLAYFSDVIERSFFTPASSVSRLFTNSFPLSLSSSSFFTRPPFSSTCFCSSRSDASCARFCDTRCASSFAPPGCTWAPPTLDVADGLGCVTRRCGASGEVAPPPPPPP